jgi:hypothetical protein
VGLLKAPELVRAEIDQRMEKSLSTDPMQQRKNRLERELKWTRSQLDKLLDAYQEEGVALQSPGENPTDAAKCLDGELLGCFAAIGKDFGNCRATEELRRVPLRRCCAPEAQGYEGEHSTKFRKRHPEGAPRHAARGKISAPLDCVNLILWGAYPRGGRRRKIHL